MKIIAEKNEKLSVVLESVSSIVNDKYYYIPGWFEKTKDGNYIFHHMNKLPKELTDFIKEQREETPKKK